MQTYVTIHKFKNIFILHKSCQSSDSHQKCKIMEYTFKLRRRSSSKGTEWERGQHFAEAAHRGACHLNPTDKQELNTPRARSLEVGVEAVAARAAAQAELLKQGQRVAALFGLLGWWPGLGRGPQRTGIGHRRLAPCWALLAAAVGRLCDLLVGHEGWELAEVLQHRVVEGTGHLRAVGLQLILSGLDSLGWRWEQTTATGFNQRSRGAPVHGLFHLRECRGSLAKAQVQAHITSPTGCETTH